MSATNQSEGRPGTVKIYDNETKQTKWVSERAWNLSLKKTKMKNGKRNRYDLVSTKEKKSTTTSKKKTPEDLTGVKEGSEDNNGGEQ